MEARYDKNRDPEKGTFVKGNHAGRYSGQKWIGKAGMELATLKAVAERAITADKLTNVFNSLYDLAINCVEPETKLRAGIYLIDRFYGRPKESREIMTETVRTAQVQLRTDLTPEEMEQLGKLVGKPTEEEQAAQEAIQEAVQEAVDAEIVEAIEDKPEEKPEALDS